MANRRCLMAFLMRHCRSLHTRNALGNLNPSFLHSSESLQPKSALFNSPHFLGFEFADLIQSNPFRSFSSSTRNSKHKTNLHGKEEEEDDDDDDYEVGEGEDDDEECEDENSDSDTNTTSVSRCIVERADVTKENENEAAAIGYKVIGPLDPSERPFKPWEPVFAVVQIGSHQFKVCNGDAIFTERLKFCQVNDKLILNRVLMLGSKSQTMIGRPILPDAAVHAVVEEHALDAKVIIFKKKRRKNYRRTKGHRQELTKLRITDIHGIEKPQPAATHGSEERRLKAIAA